MNRWDCSKKTLAMNSSPAESSKQGSDQRESLPSRGAKQLLVFQIKFRATVQQRSRSQLAQNDEWIGQHKGGTNVVDCTGTCMTCTLQQNTKGTLVAVIVRVLQSLRLLNIVQLV